MNRSATHDVPTTRSDPIAARTDASPETMRVVPIRRYGSWIAAGVLLVVFASLAWSLWNNPNLDRGTVAEYLFKDLTLRGLLVTIELTVLAMLIGIAGGMALAVMRLSANPVLVAVSTLYIWFFRGTPLLVQLLFWGFLGALYPELTLGIPFIGVEFGSAETSTVISVFAAALLGLGLNEAAYAAEIVRAGIQSVDEGQTEAAYSLGMTPGQTTRRIVLPQAMRVIIPPMGNETITMLKMTALVSVISGNDLLTNLQEAYAQNFQVIPLLVVACIWYLVLVSLLSIAQHFLERRYGRGAKREGQYRTTQWLPRREAASAMSELGERR